MNNMAPVIPSIVKDLLPPVIPEPQTGHTMVCPYMVFVTPSVIPAFYFIISL